ncbi:hypothetical protein C8B47_03735 [filamentous cyanobacterium CCP4]|nr:hypothetical protein C8B47_03735 [filamentous cyanobacterium CCP4]
MSVPQPGTLKYIILKRISISITHDSVVVLITDGTTTRRTVQKAPKDAPLDNVSHNILATLWLGAETVSNKAWRTASQRKEEGIINNTVDTILQVLASNATPDFNDIRTAARNVLLASNKLDDWAKLNTMLQNMSETELRQFLSFIILITLSKSAGD